MSRWQFDDRDDRWYVGYDHALRSYFAQVEPCDPNRRDDNDDTLIDVVDGFARRVASLDELQQVLRPKVQLPVDVETALLDAETGRTSARGGFAPSYPDVAANGHSTAVIGAHRAAAEIESMNRLSAANRPVTTMSGVARTVPSVHCLHQRPAGPTR